MCSGVDVFWCGSRGPGGSSVQHVPGRFCHHLCEKSGKKEGKSRDRPRGKSGEERAIKREGTRG